MIYILSVEWCLVSAFYAVIIRVHGRIVYTALNCNNKVVMLGCLEIKIPGI